MKLIENTYQHKDKELTIKVTTCNKKIVTAEDLETGETTKFNRGKFEWMVKKGVFIQRQETE